MTCCAAALLKALQALADAACMGRRVGCERRIPSVWTLDRTPAASSTSDSPLQLQVCFLLLHGCTHAANGYKRGCAPTMPFVICTYGSYDFDTHGYAYSRTFQHAALAPACRPAVRRRHATLGGTAPVTFTHT